MRLSVTALRDQIAAPARPVLLVLLAAAAVVFIIACSNVANLILARSVRREGELAVRAALGASRGALRRTLLAESLVLCGAGAILGILLARPLVAIVASFAARFSVRALEVSVDSTLLWVGAALAMAAAVLLAYVPKLPAGHAPTGSSLASGSLRITPGTNRRLRVFATTQIAFCFVMLAGAATLLATLIALQTANTGYNMRQVLAIDVPMPTLGVGTDQSLAFYEEVTRKVGELPGVDGVSLGSFTPWRDAGRFGGAAGIGFGAEGYTPANGEENPRARLRIVAPRFFDVLGVPLLAGRDFTADDRRGSGERRDRQPERGAAHFPEWRRAQSQAVVDRSVLRSQAVPATHRRCGCGCGRREHREGRGDDGVSPAAADGCGRPAVRARLRRSLRARAGGDARSFKACRPISRWSAPQRSRMCARKCSRPNA